MWNFLLVGLGGGLGAMGRYAVGLMVGARPSGWPMATFIANVSGGLLMGLLAALLLRLGGESWRLFLGVGVLGGYTTFSSFSLETLLLIDNGQVPMAVGYAFFSVLVALIAIAVGMALGRLFA